MAEHNKETPLYLGHRARLRERFLINEGVGMPDYEILELILMLAIPRRDVKPLAKKLINHYGDLNKVLHAPQNDLRIKFNLSDITIAAFKVVTTCIFRSNFASFSDISSSLLDSWEWFENHCRDVMGHKDIEEFRVFFFDASLHYIKEAVISQGTIDKSTVYPREIIRRALECKSSQVVLSHNHPSGNSLPSAEDKRLTESLIQILYAVDIKVYDHVIVTSADVFSFRNAGFIDTYYNHLIKQQKLRKNK